MHELQKNFKRPPRKHTPKGLEILYEDRDIVVVEKINGLLTVGTEKVKENTAHFLVNEYVRKGNSKSKNRAYIVHRLDKDTSGILVFAKSEEVKEFLQKNWMNTKKQYVAVLSGVLEKKEGLVSSYLLENSVHRMYSVPQSKEGKLSKTGYRVIKESDHFSLVEVDLLTGRKHQIRVHMADLGCPVAGDKKYGVKGQGVKRLCLHAASLTITHPFSKESMTFESEIPPYFHNVMCKKLEPAKEVKSDAPAPRGSAPSATANKRVGGKKPKKSNAQRKAAALKREKNQRRK
jgi:tRNA pseudouridine32 synthase/23S rRNA pseudouridine746 synthase/23S rRNA pseudouridine1911/1915/1917 synthase